MKSAIQQLCYLLIMALLFALAVFAAPDPNAADMDRTPRPDHATSPEWQGRSVADGACIDIVRPSEVTGEER